VAWPPDIFCRVYARCGGVLAMTFVSDDVAGQTSLLIAPGMWRRHLQPRLELWCRPIHDLGGLVFHRTDGAARPLFGPIVDGGVDVLNPIQPACPGMDLGELKREFGDRVVFRGGVDKQSVLSRGSPEDVRAQTRRCIETLGAGGVGYIVYSCHNVQLGRPLENVEAMIETTLNWSWAA